MTVTNESGAAVEINEAWLPWGHLYTTALVALWPADPGDRGRTLERTTVQANPFGSVVTIRPGESRTGDIALDRQFPDLRAWLERSQIILFWSYVPRYTTRVEGPRTGGWLVIPREGEAGGPPGQ
jgi:hypothetical protein